MLRTSHQRSFFVFVVFVAVAALPSTVFANHSWGGYHWGRTANPFTLKLGDNLSVDWTSYLTTTSSDWSQSTVLDTVVVVGQSKGRCRPTSGRDEVCSDRYGNNGWLGLAQIWISGSHITQGAVKVNDTYFNSPPYNNSSEKEHVMCQEVGHTLGLDHQDTSGASLNTCMDYYLNTSSSDTLSTHPDQHDYDELVTIYSHLDSLNTVFGVNPGLAASSLFSFPPAMDQIDLDGPGQWGVEIKREGNSSTFELDFGNGNKVITYVIWTRDAAERGERPERMK